MTVIKSNHQEEVKEKKNVNIKIETVYILKKFVLVFSIKM